MSEGGIDRREFLKGAAATVALLFTADTLAAAAGETAVTASVSGPAVKIGVIGLGQWGKDLVANLAKMPSAQVTAICDTYDIFVKRAAKSAPNAATFSDYKKLLESPDVEAVVIATPTHQHKEIALAAIQAGKHVYCETPLAITIEDAKAIALAGKNSGKVFQVGQQGRSNPLYVHVEQFIRTGCWGNVAQVYAQSNKKQSWRRMAPTPDREKEINWRLNREMSLGIVGETGIHQIDVANWFLSGPPTAVYGFGSTNNWNDGRDVPDTVQCVLEYPRGVRMVFTSTLGSSFSGEYTVFEGSDCSLALRDTKGWMIKEADAPLLGWEVYARKEQVFDETGIAMVADATKILKAGGEPGKDAAGQAIKEPIYCALENFTKSIRENTPPACDAVAGYQAAVTVIKANEAINTNSKIAYQADWFELK